MAAAEEFDYEPEFDWAAPVVEHARALNKVARHRRHADRPTTISPGDLLALKVPVDAIVGRL